MHCLLTINAIRRYHPFAIWACCFITGISVVYADPSETLILTERQRLVLYAEGVAIDGLPHPDLARARIDSLSACFLNLDPGMEVVELRQGLVSQGFFDSKWLCFG
jgi:hypothetical protein